MICLLARQHSYSVVFSEHAASLATRQQDKNRLPTGDPYSIGCIELRRRSIQARTLRCLPPHAIATQSNDAYRIYM